MAQVGALELRNLVVATVLGAAGFPEVPVIPEADSLLLLVGGLLTLGAVAGLAACRRRTAGEEDRP